MSMRFQWLQFFADGASGGDGGGEGAAAGVSAADAGQQTGVEAADAGRTLEDLGVPHERAERYRKRKGNRQEDVPQRSESPAAETEQQNTVDWDSFMAIPENKERLQTMMSERGKQASAAKQEADAQMGKIAPMLELIAARYEIEAKDGKLDLDALIQAVMDDDSYYERRAEDLGVDVSVAKQLEQAERERKIAQAQKRAMEEERAKQEREFQLQQHFYGMQQQADRLRELFPDFDLNRELQDPVFLQRTSPEGGMSVEDAFYSIHHGEIMERQAEAIARRARTDAANAIRSGARPRENGSAATATAAGMPDLKQMTREQRTAYIKAKYPPPR